MNRFKNIKNYKHGLNTLNSFTDFSQNLRTKSKQCLPQQLAWKKIPTQTKFKNKKSNSYKFMSDSAESNSTMTPQQYLGTSRHFSRRNFNKESDFIFIYCEITDLN